MDWNLTENFKKFACPDQFAKKLSENFVTATKIDYPKKLSLIAIDVQNQNKLKSLVPKNISKSKFSEQKAQFSSFLRRKRSKKYRTTGSLASDRTDSHR